jgi:dihydropyrimidine dehydrogenase (NAD+) subunit PreA
MHFVNYGGKRAMAYQNVEQISDRPLRHNLLEFLYLKKHYPDHPIIASIMGFFEDEWVYLAKACEDHGADMLELNFSCPHMCIEGSGHKVGQAFHLLERFTAAVKQAVSIPVMAKMTPNITDMTEPALFAKKGGADAISAINTVRGISEIGREDWVPRPNVFGVGAISGTSGPAVKPIGLNFIASMARCREIGLPLSGMGGIETWIDALEYLLVGATTLQVTSGIMHYGYRIVEDLIEGLSDYMALKGIDRVSELIGRALPHLQETDHFDLKRQGIVNYNLELCIGCGQCHIVCSDAAGQAVEWDSRKRRPRLIEDKCLSCMLCQAVCPVPGLITFKEMPSGWRRRETAVRDSSLESELKHEPFTKEGPYECVA